MQLDHTITIPDIGTYKAKWNRDTLSTNTNTNNTTASTAQQNRHQGHRYKKPNHRPVWLDFVYKPEPPTHKVNYSQIIKYYDRKKIEKKPPSKVKFINY
jgi:hypothetical protein